MPFRPVLLRPGPTRLAAACALAGFSQAILYPDVTDGCGKVWKSPSALLIIMGIVGGESAGNAWAYNTNYPGTAQQSTDYGLLEINSTYNPEAFGKVTSPLSPNWAIYYDNTEIAYGIYLAARAARLKDNPTLTHLDWKPWHAFSDLGFARPRYNNKSWLDWGNYGISQMNAALKTGATLDAIASINLDPLVYD